jgi:hypothetical protein
MIAAYCSHQFMTVTLTSRGGHEAPPRLDLSLSTSADCLDLGQAVSLHL